MNSLNLIDIIFMLLTAFFMGALTVIFFMDIK